MAGKKKVGVMMYGLTVTFKAGKIVTGTAKSASYDVKAFNAFFKKINSDIPDYNIQLIAAVPQKLSKKTQFEIKYAVYANDEKAIKK